jgi:acetyl-CoA synthetase
VDHHVAHGRGGHAALVYLNERGDRSVVTYAQLLFEVKRLAAALRALGLRKGDRITIYMPTSTEAIMLMLATVRIGAIHSVVFAEFGANALGDRIAASGSRLVFTADVTYRKGKNVALKPIVDEALKVGGASVEHIVVWEREDKSVPLQRDDMPRDITWTQFVALGDGHSSDVEKMEANEPAWILATSGTTAKPKLAVHTHGGYQVHIVSMARWCFGMTSAGGRLHTLDRGLAWNYTHRC